MVLIVELASGSGCGVWAWRQSARCSTSATSRSMSGSPRAMGSAIKRRPVGVVRAYLMPHRWTPHPRTRGDGRGGDGSGKYPAPSLRLESGRAVPGGVVHGGRKSPQPSIRTE